MTYFKNLNSTKLENVEGMYWVLDMHGVTKIKPRIESIIEKKSIARNKIKAVILKTPKSPHWQLEPQVRPHPWTAPTHSVPAQAIPNWPSTPHHHILSPSFRGGLLLGQKLCLPLEPQIACPPEHCTHSVPAQPTPKCPTPSYHHILSSNSWGGPLDGPEAMKITKTSAPYSG